MDPKSMKMGSKIDPKWGSKKGTRPRREKGGPGGPWHSLALDIPALEARGELKLKPIFGPYLTIT